MKMIIIIYLQKHQNLDFSTLTAGVLNPTDPVGLHRFSAMKRRPPKNGVRLPWTVSTPAVHFWDFTTLVC